MDQRIESTSWCAALALEFGIRSDAHQTRRTVLTHRRHHGPLVVQRPFYPEQDTCHVYLLHPPGGIAGGDQLNIDIAVHNQAHSLITTPAATKFYCSDGPHASQHQTITLAADSRCEWLPQETILFNGCNVRTGTTVQLQRGARFIGWEILCLGRPASRDWFVDGSCRQHFELWQDGQALFIERALLEGANEALQARWGLAGNPVTGTMIITPAGPVELEAVREKIKSRDDALLSATLIHDVLVIRYLGPQGEHARQCFTQAWECVRPTVMGKPVCAPRIWYT